MSKSEVTFLITSLGVQATGQKYRGYRFTYKTGVDRMNITSFMQPLSFKRELFVQTNKQQQQKQLCFVEIVVLGLYPHSQRLVGQNQYLFIFFFF